MRKRERSTAHRRDSYASHSPSDRIDCPHRCLGRSPSRPQTEPVGSHPPPCGARLERLVPVTAVAFDTLKFAQTLRDKAKFTPEQAEGLSEAFAQASAEPLATKSDISGLCSDLREAELRLEAKIEATGAEILKWMFGTIGFQTIVILG